MPNYIIASLLSLQARTERDVGGVAALVVLFQQLYHVVGRRVVGADEAVLARLHEADGLAVGAALAAHVLAERVLVVDHHAQVVHRNLELQQKTVTSLRSPYCMHAQVVHRHLEL